MFKKNFLQGIQIGLGILFIFSLFFGIIFAVGFHSANEITSGIFQGNYTFNGTINSPSLQRDIQIATYTGASSGESSLIYFQNGFFDSFNDETGIDLVSSTNYGYNSVSNYFSGRDLDIFDFVLSDGNDANTGWALDTVRQVIPASAISSNSDLITITIENQGGSIVFDNIAIVERSGSTDDGVTTPTEIFFSGTSGVTVNSQRITSDELNYSIDSTKDYLVIFDVGSSSNGMTRATSGGGGRYSISQSDSYNIQSISGSFTAGHNAWITNITSIGAGSNFSIVSYNYSASNPSTSTINIIEESSDSVPNTDIIASVSNDGGTNWEIVTLNYINNYSSTKRILTGDVTFNSNGNDIRYNISTFNDKEIKLHGVGINWN